MYICPITYRFHLPKKKKKIYFRNRSAENLYGWKEYEVLGQQVAELLIPEEYYAPLKNIMDRLSTGQSWTGRFPFKKRSGEIFMAIVTKSPLYEDGELAGFVTVSSDATLYNSKGSDNLRTCRDHAGGSNLKRIQCHPRPPIVPMPQIASSVSNLVRMIYLISILFPPIFCSNHSVIMIIKLNSSFYGLIRPQNFYCGDVEMMHVIHRWTGRILQ